MFARSPPEPFCNCCRDGPKLQCALPCASSSRSVQHACSAGLFSTWPLSRKAGSSTSGCARMDGGVRLTANKSWTESPPPHVTRLDVQQVDQGQRQRSRGRREREEGEHRRRVPLGRSLDAGPGGGVGGPRGREPRVRRRRAAEGEAQREAQPHGRGRHDRPRGDCRGRGSSAEVQQRGGSAEGRKKVGKSRAIDHAEPSSLSWEESKTTRRACLCHVAGGGEEQHRRNSGGEVARPRAVIRQQRLG